MDYCYVLLCRHAAHDDGSLTSEGKKATEAVARHLRDQMALVSPHGDSAVSLRQVIHGSAREVRETVALLGLTATARCPLLDPARFNSPQTDEALTDWLLTVAAGGLLPAQEDLPEVLEVGNAVMVVGHQPHLSWLSHALLRRGRIVSVGNRAVPIVRSEVVCLAFRRRASGKPARAGRVLWTITPDDVAAAEQIRAKIRSKMETAKLLSAVIMFALGALLSLLLDPGKWATISPKWPVQWAAGLLLAGLVLYLATMYAYDSLLMPERFWSDRRPLSGRPVDRGRGWLVQRPPSSSAWVLYVNMMRVWRGLFTPATVCVIAALCLVSRAALHLHLPVYLGAGAALAFLIYWYRPKLGSED